MSHLLKLLLTTEESKRVSLSTLSTLIIGEKIICNNLKDVHKVDHIILIKFVLPLQGLRIPKGRPLVVPVLKPFGEAVHLTNIQPLDQDCYNLLVGPQPPKSNDIPWRKDWTSFRSGRLPNKLTSSLECPIMSIIFETTRSKSSPITIWDSPESLEATTGPLSASLTAAAGSPTGTSGAGASSTGDFVSSLDSCCSDPSFFSVSTVGVGGAAAAAAAGGAVGEILGFVTYRNFWMTVENHGCCSVLLSCTHHNHYKFLFVDAIFWQRVFVRHYFTTIDQLLTF